MNDVIDWTIFEQTRHMEINIPRVCRLLKTQKWSYFVPIPDVTNSRYHSVARWLARLLGLAILKTSGHSLKDTFELIDSVKELNING